MKVTLCRLFSADSREAEEANFVAWSSANELWGLKVNVDESKLLVSGNKNEAPEPS